MSRPDFPHESTADQLFDEPQFESHRLLGCDIVGRLFEEALQTSAGRSARGSRDLQGFVDWLVTRAADERKEALAQRNGRPAAPAPVEPPLPYCQPAGE